MGWEGAYGYQTIGAGQTESGTNATDNDMWRHVSNVPGTFGTLETCRHIR